MEIKYDKPRDVVVPYSLMEDMWAYAQLERNLHAGQPQRRELILTVNGNAFTNASAGKAFAYLSQRIQFKVTPLMLRHSYAVHTLLVLRTHPELGLEPLMWLRDRLGHESVETTMVYLSQIERLMGDEQMQLAAELDALYGITTALPISARPPATDSGKH
jgi:integrase